MKMIKKYGKKAMYKKIKHAKRNIYKKQILKTPKQRTRRKQNKKVNKKKHIKVNLESNKIKTKQNTRSESSDAQYANTDLR